MSSVESGAVARGGMREFACFEVGGRAYAIDVMRIREIVRWQEPTPLPRAPEWIEGLIDLRESVVPVVDLARVLGDTPNERSARARIVVLAAGNVVLGLRVDAAVDVVCAAPSALEPPPALAAEAGYGVIEAVLHRTAGRPLPVLSVENLIASVQGSAIPERRGES